MLELLAVGAGGFFGAIARYTASGLVQRVAGGSFPAGTFIVNIIGCLCIGVIMGLVETRSSLSPHWRLFLIVGLLGSFTTFSTFGYESVELLRSGALRMALLYVVGSAAVGLLLVVLGRSVVRAWIA